MPLSGKGAHNWFILVYHPHIAGIGFFKNDKYIALVGMSKFLKTFTKLENQ